MPPVSVSAATLASHSFRYASSRNRQSVAIVALTCSRFYEGRGDGRFLFKPGRHGKFFRAQEIRIEQFGLVAVTVIGKHGHDRLALAEILGEPDRACDIDAGRAAKTKPFMLEQIEN